MEGALCNGPAGGKVWGCSAVAGGSPCLGAVQLAVPWCCAAKHAASPTWSSAGAACTGYAAPRRCGTEGVKVVPGGRFGNRVKEVYRETFSPLFVNEAGAGIPHLPQVFSGSHKCY